MINFMINKNKNIMVFVLLIMVCMLFFNGLLVYAEKNVDIAKDVIITEDIMNELKNLEEEIVIGLSMQEMSDYLTKLTEACVSQADELPNVKLIVVNALGDIQKQINDCESLVIRKVDVVILSPIDMVGAGPAVDVVKDEGIPLVELNTLTYNSRWDVYAGSNEIEAGRLQGQYLREQLGGKYAKGKIIYFMGVIGHVAQVERSKGVYETLINPPETDIEVLVEVPVEHWSREGALNKMADYLRIYPEIDAIASISDQLSMGALQAIKEAGRLDEIIVTGTDAMEDALIAIEKGEMGCSIFQDAQKQGKVAVKAAVLLALGKEVPRIIYVPFELVTKENVDIYKAKRGM